jgi:ADP-ribose pyrophosphatase YjhB (NUDIX family)
LRYQPLPELKLIGTNKKANSHGLYPCCVTGSIELGETPQQNVIKEIYEEFNLKIKSQNIKASSINVSSTQMNECVYTFVVDITNAIAVNKTCGDGSFFENVSENHWVSQKQLRKILISKHNPYLSSLGSAYLLFEYVV